MGIKASINEVPVLTEKPAVGRGVGVFNNPNISIWAKIKKVGKPEGGVTCELEYSYDNKYWYPVERAESGEPVTVLLAEEKVNILSPNEEGRSLFAVPLATLPGAKLARVVATAKGDKKNHYTVSVEIGFDVEE